MLIASTWVPIVYNLKNLEIVFWICKSIKYLTVFTNYKWKKESIGENHNYQEYVVPKSIPMTVPRSSLDLPASLAKVGTKNSSIQKAKMDFLRSMARSEKF